VRGWRHARGPEHRPYGWERIDGFSQSIENATQQICPHRNLQGVPQGNYLGPGMNAMSLRQGHEKHPTLTKSDYFGQRVALLVPTLDSTKFSHGAKRALALNHQADELNHPSAILDHTSTSHPLQYASQSLTRRCA
jgi:hypothetical protein